MKPSIGALILAGALVACGETRSADPHENVGGGGLGGAESDDGGAPESPPAQGAVIFTVKPAAPPPVGQSCPTAAFTADVPEVLSSSPPELLTDRNYIHKVVDGEDGTSFSCRVASDNDGWLVEASISRNGRGLRIEGGQLGADEEGTGTITVSDAQRFPPLTSSEPCTLTAMPSNNNNLQIRAGSVWGRFVCAAVESPPADSCAADGVFVLENCDQ
jgi:hypothetical protein